MIVAEDDAGPEQPAGVKVRRIRHASQAEQIAFLRQMVNLYRGNELIRQKAHDIVFRWAGCPAKKKLCHAVAIGRWVQKHITYVNEGVETFQSPVRTLTYRYGDCDDFTTLIGSLLESIGIRSELVGLEWRGQFRHIFARAVVQVGPGEVKRLPLDATLSRNVCQLPNPVAIAVRRGDKPRVLAL